MDDCDSKTKTQSNEQSVVRVRGKTVARTTAEFLATVPKFHVEVSVFRHNRRKRFTRYTIFSPRQPGATKEEIRQLGKV